MYVMLSAFAVVRCDLTKDHVVLRDHVHSTRVKTVAIVHVRASPCQSLHAYC
jgi:hypothetical protein